MQFPWLRFYPQGVGAQIHIAEGLTIDKMLDQTCQEYDRKTALTCMGTNVTFRQFARMADSFARYLQQKAGVKKGDRVAIMLPNIIQFPVALYGVLKAGGVCVNTNPLYTPREMKHQFVDSGATVIVIVDLFLDKLEEIIKDTEIKTVIVTSIADQLPVVKGLLVKAVMNVKGLVPKHNLKVVPFKDVLAEGSTLELKPTGHSTDDLSVLQYTGGTTGVSKGAMLTHRNLLANVLQIKVWASPYVGKSESETILTALPLYHIFALSVNFLTFITYGGRMILVPKPIPIENTVKIFKKYNITVMTGVNTLFNAMNNSPMFQKLAPRSLKVAIAGGMALQDKVSQQFKKITGLPITEGYGLTEASPVTHCNPLSDNLRPGSIGVPVPSTESRIVDENGKTLGVDEIGEIAVRGPQVMAGYWRRPDETAKVIRDGWLFTGDLARMDKDGYFYIVDRKKDMILVSGFNVYPNEVEEVIALHDKVLEAAVIGVSDGGGSEFVRAFIVKKDQSLTIDELKQHCEKNLTNYKRPKEYVFKDSLPKSNVGKILRRELRS